MIGRDGPQLELEFQASGHGSLAVREVESVEGLPFSGLLHREPRSEGEVSPLDSEAGPEVTNADALQGEAHLRRGYVVSDLRVKMLLLADRDLLTHFDSNSAVRVDDPERNQRATTSQLRTKSFSPIRTKGLQVSGSKHGRHLIRMEEKSLEGAASGARVFTPEAQ